MSAFESFQEYIIKNRVNYLRRAEKKLKEITPKNPEKAFAKYMLCEEKYSLNEFLSKSRDSEYFKKLKEKIGQFSLESVLECEDLFGIDVVSDGSMKDIVQKTKNSVDFVFSSFIEPVRSFPLFFSGLIEEIREDLNCVGVALSLIVLYSYEKDVNDLRIDRIFSTRRVEKVVDAIKRLESKREHVIIDINSPVLLKETKEIIRKNLIDKIEKIYNEYHKENGKDFVYVDVDTYHGEYVREHILNVLIEHVIELDSFEHVQIYNEKRDETYDYELEVTNKKFFVRENMEEGVVNLVLPPFSLLYSKLFPEDIDNLIGFFKSNYSKKDYYYHSTLITLNHTRLKVADSIFEIMNANFEIIKHLNEIIRIFGDDIPLKWLLFSLSLGLKDEDQVRELIKKRFGSVRAFDVAKLIHGFS